MLTWKATYQTEEVLPQFNPDGSENLYKNINRAILKYFDLLDGEKTVYRLYLNPDQRLIFRRRNFVTLSKEGEQRNIVYLVGWQMRVEVPNKSENGQWNGVVYKNISAINYIYEDGSVALDSDRKDIQYLPEEQ